MGPLTTRYTPRVPVSLPLTLSPFSQGSTDPTIRRDAGAWWLALATPAGPATLRLWSTREGIDAQAWGDGAEGALAAVPGLLGAHDDTEGFDPGRHPPAPPPSRRP